MSKRIPRCFRFVDFPDHDFTILHPDDNYFWYCDDNDQVRICEKFISYRSENNDGYFIKGSSKESPKLLQDIAIEKLSRSFISAALANYVFQLFGIWVNPLKVPYFLKVLIDNSIVVEC